MKRSRLPSVLALTLATSLSCSEAEPEGGGESEVGAAAVPGAAAPASTSRDWPRFRGAGGTGVSETAEPPVEWSADEGIAWRAQLPGPGASSPIVVGDTVVLTCHTGYGLSSDSPGAMEELRRLVLCFRRADGEPLWQTEVPSRLPEERYQDRMFWHGYATPTPAADADSIYVFFGKSGVAALDHAGEIRWHTHVGDATHGWGCGTSPVLHGDLVIVNAFTESGALVALDKRTGDEVWRAPGLKESWNTPQIVRTAAGEDELVVGIFGEVLGFDPATGEELWRCKGPDWYIVGSMVAHGDVVFCIAGRDHGSVAVRAGGRGDVGATHLVWESKRGSNVVSPLYHDGLLYFAHESGALAACLDAKTGEEIYYERLPGRPDTIYASPVLADGKLYYLDRRGTCWVLAAGRDYRVLATNQIDGDEGAFNASPALSGNALFLRSDRYLYAIGSVE